MKPLKFNVNEVLKLFEENKVFDLRGLSSRLVREAALNNDYVKAELGVIAYALHKIESKQHFVKSPKWSKLKKSVKENFRNAEKALNQNNNKLFLNHLKKIIHNITHIDSQLGNYAIGIYDKAKVKQASLAYSYGLSIAQAAQLTGADKKELQEYIGATTMHDEEIETKNLVKRVEELRRIVEKN